MNPVISSVMSIRQWVSKSANLPKIKVRPELLAVVLSLYFTFFCNDELWSRLLKSQAGNMGLFFWTVCGIVVFLQVATITLLMWGKSSRYVAVFLVGCTVFASYFSRHYGVQFDASMMQNVFATNVPEANELLTVSAGWHALKLGLLPIIGLLFFEIQGTSLRKELYFKAGVALICLALAVILIFSQFKNFSSTMRNHKDIRYQILPISVLVSSVTALAGNTKNQIMERKEIDPGASRKPASGRKPKTVVVVVGETVRAANWGLSGYARQTTPELSGLPVINFPYVTTCGTNTETSVPCMFSPYGRNQYDEDKIRSTESVLHLLHRLNVDVTWIDNQSGCKGVCADLKTVEAKALGDQSFCKDTANCLDEVLVQGLMKTFGKGEKDQLIVLHQLGSHGPAYYERYPKEFEKFKPACRSSDLGNCKNSEIVNAYDNSIGYTDHVLSRMIHELEGVKDRDTFFIYLSDHGESLGENNLYLHGIPYVIAPLFQTRAPMFFWHSDHFPVDHACLSNKAKKPAHHDNLYHSLLGLFEVTSRTYVRSYDLLAECHAG
uniref:Sulfatase n=1 Tax=Candidatus Nitrotoga fabula TaxID=2182327 RepID=A0A2X0SG96_9PROT|nr:Sulfatase [Candidatus Nitrotoga fabula]